MTSVSGSGERLLAILGLFSEEQPEWRPDEMMKALGYSRPTLYRYLKTLKDAGYLVSLPRAGYTLGPRVTELDFLMRRSDPLIAIARDHLVRLARQAGGSAFVLRWYGRKLLCIASEVAIDHRRSSYPRGRPMPLGRGAGSRAIVAFLPSRQRAQLIADHLDEFTTAGIGATRDAVETELARVRRDGVAEAHGEVTRGLVGLAAPILVADDVVLGALCLSAEAGSLDAAKIAMLRDAIRRSAADISRQIDHCQDREIA